MKTKKFLQAENEWLWYHYYQFEDNAELVEINQYDKRGNCISCSSIVLPPAKFRPKYPKVKK